MRHEEANALRLCRQDKPHCELVSFDRHAANMFQQYVHGALAFSIKRGALLYGRKGPDQTFVDAIYEPPQVHCSSAVQILSGPSTLNHLSVKFYLSRQDWCQYSSPSLSSVSMLIFWTCLTDTRADNQC